MKMEPGKKELELLKLQTFYRILEKLTAQKMANNITEEEFHLELRELQKHVEAAYSKYLEGESEA